jgi:hypothetical protein
MSYGSKEYSQRSIQSRYEAACFKYLQYLFHGEPPWRIREAAKEVYRYSPTWVLKSETVH